MKTQALYKTKKICVIISLAIFLGNEIITQLVGHRLVYMTYISVPGNNISEGADRKYSNNSKNARGVNAKTSMTNHFYHSSLNRFVCLQYSPSELEPSMNCHPIFFPNNAIPFLNKCFLLLFVVLLIP